MKVGSLFAGVGGFDLGFQRCDMETAWMVEQDKQCQQVLRHHWPKAEVHGDIRDQTARLTPVDLICGGFPCQDYSVAGKRGGLVGDRGALWWEMRRIIADIMPTWVVGENVPGLLSSNSGRDFITIIASLVQLGYGVTWAVLDSQYFGVAQRRRRLFIVGHSGGVPRPEILALSEGMFGHPTPSREAGEEATGGVGCGIAGSVDRNMNGWPDANGHGTLQAIGQGYGDVVVPEVLAFNWQSGGDCRQNPTEERTDPLHAGQVPAVAQPLRGNVYNNSDPGMEATMQVPGTIPRRLTPTECERLQGFPDQWTAVDGMKDGPRYRMMGNAVTVNVVEWMGVRIMEADGR